MFEHDKEDIVLDFSYYQGDMNKQKTLRDNVKGIYFKCGAHYWGSLQPFTDVQFENNYEKFHGERPLGSYYFYYPHISGIKQAEHFLRITDNKIWEYPLCVDVEDNPYGTSQREYDYQLRLCMEFLDARTDMTPAIYTRGMFWNWNIGEAEWASKYPLMIALYNQSLSHPWNNELDSRYRPFPWKTYWLWQISADSPPNHLGSYYGCVGSDSIDINRINPVEHERIFGDVSNPPVEEPPVVNPPTEPPEVPESKIRVKLKSPYTVLNVRLQPSISGTRISSMRSGEIVRAYEEFPDGDNIWMLIKKSNNMVGWAAKRYRKVDYLEYLDN